MFGKVAQMDPFRGEFWLSKWGTAAETVNVLQNKQSKYRRKKPIKLSCEWRGAQQEVRFDRVAGRAAVDLVIEVLLSYMQSEHLQQEHAWSLERAREVVVEAA